MPSKEKRSKHHHNAKSTGAILPEGLRHFGKRAWDICRHPISGLSPVKCVESVNVQLSKGIYPEVEKQS